MSTYWEDCTLQDGLLNLTLNLSSINKISRNQAFSHHSIVFLRRIGHDQTVSPKDDDDGSSPKSQHKLHLNLEHSSTATSAMGLPPTPPDDLDPAAGRTEEDCDDTDSGSEKQRGLLTLAAVGKYDGDKEKARERLSSSPADSGAVSGEENFLQASGATDIRSSPIDS